MSKKRKDTNQIEVVEQALTKTEQFVQDNKKTLSSCITGLIAIVALYFTFQNFYLNPLEKEANEQMFMAEKYFELDSFNLALNGNTEHLGFLDIINDYKRTKAGNLANYYSGISYLYLGDFKQAINYLKDFSSNDPLLSPIALGARGDAHMEMGNTEKAIKLYIKASNKKNNKFSSPIYLLKAATAYESIKNYNKALKYYKKIKEEYSDSKEAKDIDKLIARVKGSI